LREVLIAFFYMLSRPCRTAAGRENREHRRQQKKYKAGMVAVRREAPAESNHFFLRIDSNPKLAGAGLGP
jgi:hypothetical protein